MTCKAKQENNGVCPYHNLQCGWPKCNETTMNKKQEIIDMRLTEQQIWQCNNTEDGGVHICLDHQNVVDFARAIEREIGFAKAELWIKRINIAIGLLQRCENEMRYAGWGKFETDNYVKKDLYEKVKEYLEKNT
jgi:hypothetical protein